MTLKGIQDEVVGDYKKTAMQLVFPKCSFKCDIENGCKMCQNSSLAHAPDVIISVEDLVKRYLSNPLTHAVVLGGLEPFDTFDTMLLFIRMLRENYECNDDIVIYTGYTEQEINLSFSAVYHQLRSYPNIIIKFGRFRPGQEPHYDEVLGIKLISDNQYAKKVSYESI